MTASGTHPSRPGRPAPAEERAVRRSYPRVVTAVPVPPFDDPAVAVAFHRALLERVEDLAVPVSDDAGVQRRMSPAIAAVHGPDQVGRCHSDHQRYPCRAAVHTALLVELPVAWTPVRLAAVLSATGLWDSSVQAADVVQPDLLLWGEHFSGPEWRATRRPDGSWSVHQRHERRNSFELEVDLADDDAMVGYLRRRVVPRPHRRPGLDASGNW